jgi:hypothetical protein
MPSERFQIRSGAWRENPPQVLLCDESTSWPARQRGVLGILVEPTGDVPVPDALLTELVQGLAGAYYNQSGSVTRGLREALITANRALFERNLRTDSEHRAMVGITCVLLREGDAYIAQLGPGVTLVFQQGALSRYPDSSAWLNPEPLSAFDLKREPAAGLRREAEPDLYHVALETGAVLLLATSSIGRVPLTDVQQALGALDGRAAWQRLVGDGALSGLLIGRDLRGQSGAIVMPDVTADAPIPSEPEARAERPPVAAPPLPAPDRLPFDIETPFQPEVTTARATQRPAEPPPWVPPVTGPAGRGTSAPLPDDMPPYEDELEDLPDDEVEETWQPVPPPRIDLDGLRSTLSEGAAKVARGTEDMLLRMLPEKLPERPAMATRRQEDISLSGRALVAVALAVPMVMLFIVLMTRAQYDRTRQSQFASLQAVAQARFDDAMRREDVALKRQELQDALDKVRDGKVLRPDDETLNALERNILRKLDEVDVVHRLYHFWRLTDVDDDATSSTDSSRIVIRGIDVYLLNRGSDRVYKFMLNDAGDALQSVSTNPVLVQKGETRDGVRLGDMVDITWLARGGQRTLDTFVVLERAGSLLAYDPQQGIDVLPVADSDRWLKPQAIGGYYGNLYVLDPLLGYILRYTPVDNAYTTPPAYYLNPNLSVDLTGAVDMAIDGNLYVLFADGKVLKFFDGDLRPFSMAGLPSRMKNPTSIFVSGKQEPDAPGAVYVADAGNERILQFDKSGNFVRQFRDTTTGNHLQNMRGIYVDDERGRLFVLSGRTLWQTNLPGFE